MESGVAYGSRGESMRNMVRTVLTNVTLNHVSRKCDGTYYISFDYPNLVTKEVLDIRQTKLDIIKESLVALEPWYIGGKVGNPMDAVNALKSIDKAVNS